MKKQDASYREPANFPIRSKLLAAWFGCILSLSLAVLAAPVSAAEARYANPKVGTYALDYCYTLGANCGKPAADAFCRSKGYRQALSFLVRENSPPTAVIGGGNICTHSGCDRIVSLVCEADAVFRNPEVKGVALDLCARWGRDCGKPAADAFCRSRGYREALDLAVRQNTPPTRVIGTGDVCNQPACDRIVAVACKGPRQQAGGGPGGKADSAADTMAVPPDASEFADFEF